MFYRIKILMAIVIVLLTLSGCGGGGNGGDRAGETIDTDGDGILDSVDTDDDNDGISDVDEAILGTNPLVVNISGTDTDGDGISDANESDETSTTATPSLKDACLPTQSAGYRGYNNQNTLWQEADCDSDTYKNGYEDIYSLTPNNYISDPYSIASKPLDTDNDKIPNVVDTDDDGDGYSDDDENASRAAGEGGNPLDGSVVPDDFDEDNISNYTDDDDDNDGISDVNEASYGSNPKDTDSDNDGILDAVENTNKDGIQDAGETNATNADTDGDGIDDGVEDVNKDGILDAKTDNNGSDKWTETDPRKADTDNDTINDKIESDTGTNPRKSDTDGDGLNDSIEDANQNGSVDGGETNPLLPDTDGDGLNDGIEDANQNGSVDAGETNPLLPDTDGDNTNDGVDAFPLDPNEAIDTDGDGTGNTADTDDDNDGISDADELDSTGKPATDPLRANDPAGTPDYDGDGVSDKEESDENSSSITPALKDPCLRVQAAKYTGYDKNNAVWKAADCDSDGVRNEYEDNASSDPYDASDTPLDTDGDGLPNAIDPDDDNDGLNDTVEDANGNGIVESNETDPLLWDTDGDGLNDSESAPLYPCPYPKGTDIPGPAANIAIWKAFTGYDRNNSIWQKEDCDNDGDANGKEDNVSKPAIDRLQSNPYDKNSFDSRVIDTGNCTYFKDNEYCVTADVNTTLWLDRNLGSTKECTSAIDTECYGDLYQWGRGSDGHEKNNSIAGGTGTLNIDTYTLNTSQGFTTNNDWAINDNDGNLRKKGWHKEGTYNEALSICPPGWRVPTLVELSSLITDNNISNRADAFNSTILHLPYAGYRQGTDGTFQERGIESFLWTSTPHATLTAQVIGFDGGVNLNSQQPRNNAYSVRCIKY